MIRPPLWPVLPAALVLLQGCAAVPMAARYAGQRHMDARLAGKGRPQVLTGDAAVAALRAPQPGATPGDARAPGVALAQASGRNAYAPWGEQTANAQTGNAQAGGVQTVGLPASSVTQSGVLPASASAADTPQAEPAVAESRGSSRVYVADAPKRKKKPPIAPPGKAAPVPAGLQYLYGSGEAAALEYQAFIALENYLLGVTSDRAIGHIVHSVVLAPDATLAHPSFLPCDTKPMAVVFDIDETTIFNLGFEQASLAAGGGYSASRWDAWEKSGSDAVTLVPGVKEAIDVARKANVEVIFNSNRAGVNAAKTAAMLNKLGVGPVAYGTNLWLKGDNGSTGNGKDSRRQAISVNYCVVAMVGDQLGDFSDLFNAQDLSLAERRALTGSQDIYLMWGHGWFLLPNPAYGTGLNGTQDEIFPLDKRWVPGSAPAPDVTKTEDK